MVQNITFSIIAAVSENGVIGGDSGPPWSYESDREFMYNKTKDKVTILGEKSYSPHSSNIPPYRIVLSENEEIASDTEQVLQAGSMDECMEIVEELNEKHGFSDFYVCGGASVYAQFIEYADRMYITRIPEFCEGETFFPFFNQDRFSIEETHNLGDCIVHEYKRVGGK